MEAYKSKTDEIADKAKALIDKVDILNPGNSAINWI